MIAKKKNMIKPIVLIHINVKLPEVMMIKITCMKNKLLLLFGSIVLCIIGLCYQGRVIIYF